MQTKVLPIRLRIKFFMFKYGLYAFIFIMIFAFAFLLNRHIEAFFLLGTYGLVRYRFPKTFHHTNVYWCVFWSIIAFWLCILTLLPLAYSLLSSIVVALILCYILYKIQDYVDAKKVHNDLPVKQFSLTSCTKDELIARCREKNISPQSTQMAIAYFVDKNKSIYDIANEYGIEYDSARIRLKRIKHRLSE